MNVFLFLYIAVLFFLLTPGVVLSLPPNSSKFVVAATHAIVFAVVYWISHKTVSKLTQKLPKLF
jgi:hypothetical protein